MVEKPEPSNKDFFFNDDEDEDITLSGDELDNIVEDVNQSLPEGNKNSEALEHSIPDLSELQPELSITEPEKFASEEQSSQNLSNTTEASNDDSDSSSFLGENSTVDREEMRKMVSYLDNLLGELPDNIIKQFSQSEYFELYKKVISQLEI